MRLRNAPIALSICLSAWLSSAGAFALVTSPVGGNAGDVEVSARATFERGKIEPNENSDSWQKARWNQYSGAVGYTYGAIGPFQDVFFRLSGTYLDIPAESSSPDVLLHPETGAVPPGQCKGKLLDNGICEFYPAEQGFLVTPALGFRAVHTPSFALGFFVQGTIPVGVDTAKYVLPRIDTVAGGTEVGVRLTPWLRHGSRVYVGSGAGDQNATIALTQLFTLEAQRWLLPWKAGFSFGPYFEGDLTERHDDIYDAAYTPGYPDHKDRVRAARFGVAMLPYVQVTEHAVLELGYVQKLFGYDATATQLYYAGVASSF